MHLLTAVLGVYSVFPATNKIKIRIREKGEKNPSTVQLISDDSVSRCFDTKTELRSEGFVNFESCFENIF